MFLITSKYFIPKGFRGVAIFPLVLLKYAVDKENNVLLNHERIHLRQQIELLIFPFFVWYFLEYLIRIIQYKNFDLAYRNISFEREAYANEKQLDYLKQRSVWRFLKFL